MKTFLLGLGLVCLADLACGSPGAPGESVGAGVALCNGILGTECLCTTGGGSNNVACSSSSVPNGVCCADLQWPASGLNCSCQGYACIETSSDGSCSCGTLVSGPTTSCAPKAGFTCCQQVHGDCQCGPNVECDSAVGDVVVAECDRSHAVCDSSLLKIVAACQ
jgi:hypothetical protein